MNTFFAIELGEDAKKTVAALSDEWKRRIGGRAALRWTAPADYHLTLKFLGDVSNEKLPPLVETASLIASRTKPVGVRAAPAGIFSSYQRARVLWAGALPEPPLTALALELDRACARLGFPAETRSFRPHITIARCEPQTIPLAPVGPLFEAFLANRFVLMQSTSREELQSEGGSRYNIVQTFPFAAEAP